MCFTDKCEECEEMRTLTSSLRTAPSAYSRSVAVTSSADEVDGHRLNARTEQVTAASCTWPALTPGQDDRNLSSSPADLAKDCRGHPCSRCTSCSHVTASSLAMLSSSSQDPVDSTCCSLSLSARSLRACSLWSSTMMSHTDELKTCFSPPIILRSVGHLASQHSGIPPTDPFAALLCTGELERVPRLMEWILLLLLLLPFLFN